MRRLWLVLPGLAICGLLTAIIIEIRKPLPEYVGESLLAVLVGLLVGNLIELPPSTRAGVRWTSRTGLRLAIVFMGVRLAFSSVVRGGGAALVLLLFTMTVAAAVVGVLGRRLKLPPRLTTLLAVGTAVCGNSAIMATAPLIEADDREVAFAVATITIFGTLAVFVFPFVGHLLTLPPWLYGVWAGAAINDTSQVLAAGAAYGDVAASVATVVKLTRNALMAPILIVIGLHGARQGRVGGWSSAVYRSIPLFVIGFIVVAGLNSLGVFPPEVRALFQEGSRLLILAALVGIGMMTRLADVRGVGPRPFLVGLGAAVGLAGATLLATVLTQGVWGRVFGTL